MEIEKELKNYEIGFLIKDENDRQEIVKALNNYQAAIINEGEINGIRLAYPIKKETAAYFGYVHFSAEPAIIKKLEDSLRLNPKILRFLIITPPAAKTKSIFYQPRAAKPFVPRTARTAVSKSEIRKAESQPVLTNEALEKKLEEILK
ncbi:MAG: 30S ribosomal protein S6 [Candidatus Wolfebacteria bacterium GW2011_GWA2_42_10]|uniref:Small ribosomal subunit protein bS6 n=2 Tax=Candidatus Wolfeibacteriota TaxID=1752735 RepID=A0A0G0XJN8_9BACT|nr:MAG: 30S ribosomal protein S6 [Candidatus Wolfebacteria bacterium GW2011_GWB1_41_12]KKS25089.1 MAG: 30S ribosomal protein S6 [Candidatus Wolfebacteria bacterium GW2011_GWA2_42_10]KKT56343.1 MAG: 30S ribosomal protein S6 [Candidatus Wolfebacteria bacterium GW2011_GWA1_44_24]